MKVTNIIIVVSHSESEGGKGNVHEEGMSFGTRPPKNAVSGDEWVEEDFGKEQETAVPKRTPRKARTPKKGKG